MYYTVLPDHRAPGFDEQRHFNQFGQYNIIFNALASRSSCENHVGCLSFKTVFNGEEWYKVNDQQKAVRPGQFLILNDDQQYSSRIDTKEKIRSLSVFFRKEFASTVFHDFLSGEENLLENPFESGRETLEFFQTLYEIDSTLQCQLARLIFGLDRREYNTHMVDEHLIFLLHHLIRSHHSEISRSKRVTAIKSSTKTEVYKRLCIAKDLLHSTFMDKPDLSMISNAACLSVPQLVRQFKAVFKNTPHQYLMQIRLAHAAGLLKQTNSSVPEITRASGFEDTSAFCRAFKSEYGMPPLRFRISG